MKILVALFALSLAALAQGPKLLVVDVDDLGREFLEAEGAAFFDVLDVHARRFDNFYTSPVCSPTRASFNYGARATHPDLLCPWLTGPNHSPYDTPTGGPLVPLAQAVSGAGVTCAKIGKWHVSALDSWTHPLEHGWDRYVGVMMNPADYWNYTLNVNGTPTAVTGTYLTTLETDLAIAELMMGTEFVSVSYHAIHDPFHVPPPDLYTGPVPVSDYAKGRAMLESLSTELGRLTSVACQLGYYLVLFSDNGGKQELLGDKGSIREGGIRTMLWVYGPGVPAGSDESLVGAFDVYATVLEFFGIPRDPSTMGPDSVSFVGAALGLGGERTTLSAERFQTNGVDPNVDPFNWYRVTRGPRFKYQVRQLREWLFDLEASPGEFVFNDLLAPGMPPLSAEAQTALDELRIAQAAWFQ